MTAQTFAQIAEIARALPLGSPDDLADRVKLMIDNAELNANDTIYVDKAAPEQQFDTIALATLESNLCYCGDFDVCEWFAQNDVRF
jgi:hypothetical protein